MIATEPLDPENQIEFVLQNYAEMVYRLAYIRTKNSPDAEDLLQEVFLRLLKSNIRFNDGEHCKAWLIRTTINCSKNLLTSAWFRKTVYLEDGLDNYANAVEKGKSNVFYAVLELPVKYRVVVHLYYYEDFSVAEISTMLNRKESTVKTQLYRARELLKKKLKGDYDYV